MLSTKSDVLDYAKHQAGVLARRQRDSAVAPTDDDDPILEEYFADALAEVCGRTEHAEDAYQITLQADQASYDLPASVDAIQGVVYATEELDMKPGPDVRRRARDATGSGAPTQYGVHGRTLWIFEVPDQATLNSNGTSLDVTFTHSGAFDDGGSPAAGMPTSGDLLDLLPRKLQAACAFFVIKSWYLDIGEMELGTAAHERAESRIEGARAKPNRTTSAERPYRPMGL